MTHPTRGARALRRAHGEWAYPTVFALLVLVAWSIAARFIPQVGERVSTPEAILGALGRVVRDGSLLVHAAASLERVIAAAGIMLLVGFPLGALAATRPRVRFVVLPLVNVLRPLPPLALLPLTVILFGIGEEQKLILLLAGMLPTFVLLATAAFATVPEELSELGRLRGYAGFGLVRSVLLPAALPGVLNAARVGLAYGFAILVTAELVGASSGLGFLLTIAWRGYDVALMWVTVGTIASIAGGLDAVGRLLAHRLTPWAKTGEGL